MDAEKRSAIVLHARMYGRRRAMDTFGIRSSDVDKAFNDPEACAMAENMLQERALTTDDEGEHAVRGYIAFASRVFDSANETDPDSIAAVAKCAEQLDSIMLNRALSRRLR